ncbi:8-oxo-dGTP diphosphatase [Christensenellaceae bacterium OttesenSCG-928-L17]|nr:8-oxo-dGTP diphosphatase [Christensenellaceae bacterium OttesenSCG-928-L17]
MDTPTTHVTWMILRKADKILLGYKKCRFGAGKWNGIGGKVDPGETIEQAAVREMQEESNVTPTKFEKVATITFDQLIYNGTKGRSVMHCFIATEWQGNPTETEEIRPEWFDISQIPYDEMWIDDTYWLPTILEGKKVEATFTWNDNYEITAHQVKILD